MKRAILPKQATVRNYRTRMLALAPALLALAPPALGATLYVSTKFGVDKSGGILGPNECTQIACATLSHALYMAGYDDTILLEGGPFDVCNLVVNKTVTIRGSGARVVLDAGDACRHFDISTSLPASVTLSNLELVDGFAAEGGSIRVGVDGELSLRNALLTRNNATNGGAIYNLGELHLLGNTAFEDNDAALGGAIYNSGGSIDATDASFARNHADVSGGAIYGATGTIELVDSSFGLNIAGGNGGAIDTTATTLDLTNTSFMWNTAEIGNGGAIANGEGSDLDLVDSSVIWNLAGASGGAISNSQGSATIVESTLTLNIANIDGGGIANVRDGVLAVRDTTLSHNSAAANGGGIADATGSATGTVIRRSTLLANDATLGGGVHFVGAPGSDLFVINSTYSQNVADFGAAIFSTGAGQAAIANATLYGQELRSAGGGALFNDSSQDMQLYNSIITATANATAIGGGPGIDCFVPGGIDGRHNLSNNCGFGAPFNLGIVTLLDPVLADHGGATQTHALLAGSNAIDAGFNGCQAPDTLQPLANDQRKYLRPKDGNSDSVALCDIGAYEYGMLFGPAPPISSRLSP